MNTPPLVALADVVSIASLFANTLMIYDGGINPEAKALGQLILETLDTWHRPVVDLAEFLYVAARTPAVPSLTQVRDTNIVNIINDVVRSSETMVMRTVEQDSGEPADMVTIRENSIYEISLMMEEVITIANTRFRDIVLNMSMVQFRPLEPGTEDIVTSEEITGHYLICENNHSFMRDTIENNCASQIQAQQAQNIPTKCYTCPACRGFLIPKVYSTRPIARGRRRVV